MTAIRREAPEDHDGVDRLLRDAFGADVPARLARALRSAGLVADDLTFVATDGDGEVVGQVMLSWLTVAGTDPFEALNLTPLAVAPTHQGRGIGRTLVEGALAAAERDSAAPLVILEGDPTHYTRYGFRRAGEAGLARPSPAIPDEAFLLRPTTRYDRQRHVGTVRYPRPFHDLGIV